ncbi:MAG: FAD-dependent oxidoreductase [Steroidobacteraceae bacterium]
MRRRSFLHYLAGGALAAFATRLRAKIAPGTRYDVIIVGAGTAGLPAAIVAAERGARVLLLEAAPAVGGTLFLSTGQMSAAGTRLQRSKGIEDSPQQHYDDVMRISRNTADPVLVRLAVNEAAATFDWLMDLGLKPLPEHPILGAAHEPYSVARYAWGANGGRDILGVLTAPLAAQVAAGRIDLALDTSVTALLTDRDGAVSGVRVKSADRETIHRGRSTVLTCGGYAANAQLFEALSGYRHYGDMAYGYSKGAGIELALAVGGYVRGRENYLCNFGSILVNDLYPAKILGRFNTVPQDRPPWEIYVNVDGKRFICEDEPSVDRREHALLAQPDLRCWIIFDEAILAGAPPGVRNWSRDDIREAFATQMMFTRADSIAKLADACGIDRDGLLATVAGYNEGVRRGRDALGRKHLPRPIVQPPFYAIRHQGHSVTSTVGVAVDGQLRVIRPGGAPIRNLYAAGELLGAGQTMGNAFVGGMMVTPALSFGRYLGRQLPLAAMNA